MKKTTRRDMLGAMGLAAGMSVLPGYAAETKSQTAAKDGAADWQYVPLDSAGPAAEAYRLAMENGCMYGVFRAILTAWSSKTGRSTDSFPFHMMRYGEGGVGRWGTLCGALNGGAAIIGLFEPDMRRRERLIGQLFSWYESAELPAYVPSDAKPSKVVKSVAESVLCHVSVARWCKASGAAPVSPERKQRCRCLTADVTIKTIELLTRSLSPEAASEPAKPKVEAAAKPPKVVGKMKCASCHDR